MSAAAPVALTQGGLDTLNPTERPDERYEVAPELSSPRATLKPTPSKSDEPTDTLEKSADAYQLLVQSIQDYAIFILNPAGYIVTWNEGARRLKGYQESEIVGKHFSIFYPPEDVANRVPQQLLSFAERDGRVEQEGWRLRKDGTRFWADVVITALRDGEGNLVGFGKVTRDVTDRRKAEEALAQSEERFQLLVESVQDYAIYMLDTAGHVVSWNPGAERFKGYREAEILGKHFSVFYSPEDRAQGKPMRGLEMAAREGHYEDVGWRMRKDGTRFWADAVITALRDGKGRLVGFGKVTRDLTERQQATEERIRVAQERAARQAAEESVRVRDEFLGVAAHELKTPVTSLLLQTQLMARRLNRDGTLDAATAGRALSMVEEQSQKLSDLVNKLLDVSRVAHGRLAIDRQTVDLVSLVESAVERSRLLAPTREVHLVAPESLLAEVDSIRLEQVITNLLDNAVKYSTDGAIEVTVSRQDSAWVRIAVRDHGPGVPVVKRLNLFAQFYQVEARNHAVGMGLGLYISKQIAQLHGGDLVAEFPPEGGSEFIVTLPQGAEPAPSDRA